MIDLRHGNCLELMKDIPDGSVDLILCDLPYGTTDCRWDEVIPFKPLWKQYRRIVRKGGVIALFSAQPFTTKLIASNLQEYKYSWYWLKNVATGFQFAKYQPRRRVEEINIFICNQDDTTGEFEKVRGYLIHEKEKTGLSRKEFKQLLGSDMASHYFTNGSQFSLPNEDAYTKLQTTGFFQKPYEQLRDLYASEKPTRIKATYNPQGLRLLEKPKLEKKYKSNGDSIVPQRLNKDHWKTATGYPDNVLEYKHETIRFHPTQKPVALLEYLVKTYTHEGETVLDNCMGSGSTGVACVNTGRKFIGIEMDDKHFETASSRINAAMAS